MSVLNFDLDTLKPFCKAELMLWVKTVSFFINRLQKFIVVW